MEERLRSQGMWDDRARRLLAYLSRHWSPQLSTTLRWLPSEEDETFAHLVEVLSELAEDPSGRRLRGFVRAVREEECQSLLS